MKYPNHAGCKLKLPIEISANSRLIVARRKVTLDRVEYENEDSGVKSCKIQALSRCNEGTIVDGLVENPNRTGLKTNSQLKFQYIKD